MLFGECKDAPIDDLAPLAAQGIESAMKQLLYWLKGGLQRLANRLGYRIERKIEIGDDASIDVFDLVVHRLIADRPDLFFVQIGAHDGKDDDPLRQYVTKHHWKGILVEPQPDMFAKLTQNYRDEPQLAFEQAAVANFDGAMTLYRPSGPARGSADTCRATFNRELLRKQLGYNVSIDELSVPAITITTLLAKHGVQRLDLLQLDTEGFDYEIIKMVAAANVKPTLLHFEHLLLSDADRQQCYADLTRQGYRLARNGINTIAYLQPAATKSCRVAWQKQHTEPHSNSSPSLRLVRIAS